MSTALYLQLNFIRKSAVRLLHAGIQLLRFMSVSLTITKTV